MKSLSVSAVQRTNLCRSEFPANDVMRIPDPHFFPLFYVNATLSVTNFTAAKIGELGSSEVQKLCRSAFSILHRITGGELFERVIDEEFVLTERACAVFMRQICEGVEFVHRQNILHLDMKGGPKPPRVCLIIVTESGPVLLDHYYMTPPSDSKIGSALDRTLHSACFDTRLTGDL
ncbi:Myosin light chain kinase, smooth muscle [Eumeta japonica]|uniref:Myosin light chain kinase, smooth muscle n=1 Tax=Eumeta variegata TaxID=151549 RepID=A0A4C1XLI5_EUMVA|nr:Myosin light chain kinase, smooth muscle [Eumeta japonica]